MEGIEHQQTQCGCFILAFSTELKGDAGVGAADTLNSWLLLLMWPVSKSLSFLSLGFPVWTVELSLATTKTKDDALRCWWSGGIEFEVSQALSGVLLLLIFCLIKCGSEM